MITPVAADQWRSAAEALLAEGYCWFGLLTAVDDPRDGTLDVVLVVAPRVMGEEAAGTAADSRAGDWRGIRTRLDRADPMLPTVSDLWSGASTAEREAAEMFALTFEGHPDPRPFLLPSGSPPVLRRDVGLLRRADTRWPGEKEPGEATSPRRRRSRALAADPDAWDGAV